MDNPNLKSARGNAQRRFDEIMRLLYDGPNSLRDLMADAMREGMPIGKNEEAWAALRRICITAAEESERLAAMPKTVQIRSHRVQL